MVGALTDRGYLFEGIKAFAGPRRLTLAIAPIEVLDDVVRLVEEDVEVRIDEQRELFLAAVADGRGPPPGAAVRGRPDQDIEVEHRERLAHLATVRTRFDVVELELLDGTRADRADAMTEGEPNSAGDRGGDNEHEPDPRDGRAHGN